MGHNVDNNRGVFLPGIDQNRTCGAITSLVQGHKIEAMFLADTMHSWVGRLKAGGCIGGPIAELPEVCADPQLRANGAFQQVPLPLPFVGSICFGWSSVSSPACAFFQLCFLYLAFCCFSTC